MTPEATIVIAQQAMLMMIVLGGPILLVSLVVGLLVSIFQAVTQINEMTLTFVPKILGIFAVLLVLGPWMLQVLLQYTANTFTSIATLVR